MQVLWVHAVGERGWNVLCLSAMFFMTIMTQHKYEDDVNKVTCLIDLAVSKKVTF